MSLMRIVIVFLFSSILIAGNSQLLAAQKDSQKDSASHDGKKTPHVYTNDDPMFDHPPSDFPPPKAPEKAIDSPSSPVREGEILAPFVPTPLVVVDKMLSLAGITSGDVVYDLGSGDGRIVIAAAQKYGAKAVGVELDRRLVEESKELAHNANVDKLVTIIQGDLLQTDLTGATVVAVYLLVGANEKLRPILEKNLKPGTPRSHA